MCQDKDDLRIPVRRRINGWGRPFDSQQLIGWSSVLLFVFLYLGIVIHSLLHVGQIVAYTVFGLTLLILIITFFLSTAIDPAPQNVRQLSNKDPVPIFDRTKAAHVIQDNFCALCDVHVGPKTKHCRSCNKCIEDFDHHCKWLNSCVGSRNYRYFIICITSSLIGSIIIFLTAFYEVVTYYICKSCLQPYLDHEKVVKEAKLKNETYEKDYLPVFVTVPDYVWLATTILIILLSLVPVILLSQLLAFHVMFYFKEMSSYEYITKLRIAAEKKEMSIDCKDKSSMSHEDKYSNLNSVLDAKAMGFNEPFPCLWEESFTQSI